MEGDECKFAVWTGHYNGKNQPASESKVSLILFGLFSQSSSQLWQGKVGGSLQYCSPTSYSQVMHTLVAADSCIHACLPSRFIGLIDIAMQSAIVCGIMPRRRVDCRRWDCRELLVTASKLNCIARADENCPVLPLRREDEHKQIGKAITIPHDEAEI